MPQPHDNLNRVVASILEPEVLAPEAYNCLNHRMMTDRNILQGKPVYRLRVAALASLTAATASLVGIVHGAIPQTAMAGFTTLSAGIAVALAAYAQKKRLVIRLDTF